MARAIPDINPTTLALLEAIPGHAALVDPDTLVVLGLSRSLRDAMGLAATTRGVRLDELLPDAGPLAVEPLRDGGGRVICGLVRIPPSLEDPLELAASLRAANQRLVLAAVAAQEAAEREERLRQEVERRAAELEAIFAALADPLLVFDRQGVVQRSNPAGIRAFGFDPAGLSRAELARRLNMQQLDGRPVAESDIPAACASASSGVAAGPPLRISPVGGGQRIIEPVAAPLLEEGRLVGAVGLWRDVTEREEMIADLQAKSAALTEADRRKNEFLALLGHELRNPLAAVSTSAQLLDRLGVEARGRRSLDIILRQVGQLTRMVDDLLDVARITHGRIQLHAQAVDLREPALRALDATRPTITSRGHDLLLGLPEEPLWVKGDPARLEQVVANLLHNAAKYTDPGGEIELRGGREDGRVWLSVRDNGMGISPELQAHLFEPFAQADRSLARSAGGLGLGLALVRQLMVLHGGGVDVQSEGRGSLFRVHLPALDPSGIRETATAALPSTEKTRRILVVEDQGDVADPLAEQLRLLGHEVRVARTAEEALRAARDEAPEVLLLDIGLPDMDGYELARRINQQAGRPLFTVAVTAYGQDEARRRSSAAGFLHHLVKPVDFSTLQRILQHDLPDSSASQGE